MKRIAILLLLTLTFCVYRLGPRPALAQKRATAADESPAAAVAHFKNGGNAAEIPAAFIDHLVFIPVRVNQSEPSLLELDTAARSSSIDPGRAAELGLGKLATPVLNLSGLDVSFSEFVETPKPDFATRMGRPYQGTLGNDFLASVVAEINYARETMQLYDPAVYKYKGRGKGFSVTFVDGMPVLKAKAIVEGRSVKADFIVNTALDAPVLIYHQYAEAHRLSLRRSISAASLPIQGAENDTIGRLSRFQLGPFQVEEGLVVFSRRAPPMSRGAQLAGEIGVEMLRRFRVIFDYPHKQIYFAPNSEFQSQDFEDMSGLTITAGGPNLKKFEITRVRPNTPGADAGLRKGDIIEGVDGDAAADLSLTDLRSLFHQVGHACELVITRNGKTLNVTMTMHRLL